MSRNPIVNAAAASIYISLVAFTMENASKAFPEKTIVGPIAFVSLFTLSAAVMGYIFVYQPAMLFLEGKKKQAINLFLQTIGVFAAITAILFLIIFSGVLGK